MEVAIGNTKAALREKISNDIDEFLKKGRIEKVKSRKAPKSLRNIFRPINALTWDEHYAVKKHEGIILHDGSNRKEMRK